MERFEDFTAVYEPTDDGWIFARVLEVPGVFSTRVATWRRPARCCATRCCSCSKPTARRPSGSSKVARGRYPRDPKRVKRRDLLRHLRAHDCELLREGLSF